MLPTGSATVIPLSGSNWNAPFALPKARRLDLPAVVSNRQYMTMQLCQRHGCRDETRVRGRAICQRCPLTLTLSASLKGRFAKVLQTCSEI